MTNPLFVKVSRPLFTVSRSETTTYGSCVTVSSCQVVKPNEVFKHGLSYVWKENESFPETLIEIESQPSLCNPFTKEAVNWTLERNCVTFLSSVFWHETNNNDAINSFFI